MALEEKYNRPSSSWSRHGQPWHHSGLRRHSDHSHPFWNVEDTFHDLEHDMDKRWENMERDMSRTFRRLGWPRAGMADFDHGLFSPYIEHETEGEETEPGKYSMNVHLGHSIEPGDVKVSLKNRTMTIEAKKERKSHDGNSRMYQEYMRKFTLPENINMNEVKSVLTPEGDLHIEAPLPQQALPKPRSEPQEIQVSQI